MIRKKRERRKKPLKIHTSDNRAPIQGEHFIYCYYYFLIINMTMCCRRRRIKKYILIYKLE